MLFKRQGHYYNNLQIILFIAKSYKKDYFWRWSSRRTVAVFVRGRTWLDDTKSVFVWTRRYQLRAWT
jgi:hypothetical protein